MPRKRKVYQKKSIVKQKNRLTEKFFWPLCDTSRRFKTCIGLSKKYLARMAILTQACFLFAFHVCVFLCESIQRIGKPRRGTRALYRGSRQGRGPAYKAVLCIIVIVISIISFFSGCQCQVKPEPAAWDKMTWQQQYIFFRIIENIWWENRLNQLEDQDNGTEAKTQTQQEKVGQDRTAEKCETPKALEKDR